MFCLLACNKRCLQLLNTWSQALAEYINVTRTKTCLELLCLPFQSIAITRSYQYRRIAQNSSWNQRLENLCCPDLVKKLNFCQAAKTQTMWWPAALSTLQADLLQFVHLQTPGSVSLNIIQYSWIINFTRVLSARDSQSQKVMRDTQMDKQNFLDLGLEPFCGKKTSFCRPGGDKRKRDKYIYD